jgi:TonB family protein
MSDKAFKRALIVSAAAHTLVLILIVLNPSFPKAAPKGVIHYLPMSAIGGDGRPAGGGTGVKAAPAKAPAAKKETLRDLTVPAKVKPKVESKLRYPTDDPKTKRNPVPEKKASIETAPPETKTADDKTAADAAGAGDPEAATGGGGSGLTIGVGGDGTGTGLGDGTGEGLADFPYAYYITRVRDKITVNWFPKAIDPGPDTVLQTVIYFRIARSGEISKIEIKQSSGMTAFDLLAQRAVTNAGPFPPLPGDYDGEYFGIYLTFEHAR